MKFFRSLHLTLFFIIVSIYGYGQNKLDSLKKAAQSSSADTNTVVACNSLAEEIVVANPQQALVYSKKALEISLLIHFKDGIPWSYSNMSEAFEYLGQIDSSVNCLERARSYKVEYGDTQGVARMDMNIGIVYLNQGYFQPAGEALFRALTVFDRLKDKAMLSKVYNNLGLLYRRTKNNKTALDFYYKSLHLKRELKDYKGQALTLGNISMLLSNQKEYAAAKKFALDGYEVCQKNDLGACTAMNLIGAAQASVRMGDYKMAKQYLAETKQYLEKYPDDLDFAGYLSAMSELARAEKRYPEAIGHAKKAVDIYKMRDMLEALQNAYSNISKMYSENKQPTEAMEWLDKSTEIRDTIFQRENLRQVNEMNILYKTESKERENEKLRMDNKLEQMRSETSERQRDYVLIFLAIMLLLGAWITRLYFQKNKAFDQLEINRKALELAVEQKDTLLRELHHRVKNNLQVVTGLLDLQMGRIKDEDVIKALNDGKNRIRSMALIHQKLYRTDDLKSVDMQEYLEKLLQEIRTGFAMPDKHIEAHIKAEAINLDIDLAIPLGLIVNEAVTNSFKYAFNDKSEGRIDITLTQNGDKRILKIKDDGPGYDVQAKTTKATLGLRLVNMLTKQIRGTIEIHNFSGTEVEIQF